MLKVRSEMQCDNVDSVLKYVLAIIVGIIVRVRVIFCV